MQELMNKEQYVQCKYRTVSLCMHGKRCNTCRCGFTVSLVALKKCKSVAVVGFNGKSALEVICLKTLRFFCLKTLRFSTSS